MDRLTRLTKREVRSRGGKIPTLLRIKIGRVLHAIAAAPLGTSWLFAVSIPMTMKASPSTHIKGFFNRRKGNGDLQLL